jgi:hypothetical protein
MQSFSLFGSNNKEGHFVHKGKEVFTNMDKWIENRKRVSRQKVLVKEPYIMSK